MVHDIKYHFAKRAPLACDFYQKALRLWWGTIRKTALSIKKSALIEKGDITELWFQLLSRLVLKYLSEKDSYNGKWKWCMYPFDFTQAETVLKSFECHKQSKLSYLDSSFPLHCLLLKSLWTLPFNPTIT